MTTHGGFTINSVERMHLQLRDMLQVVADILEDGGLEFFLGYGTALGAARDKDFIPWDLDVDLLIPTRSYAAVVEALSCDLPHPYVLSVPARNVDYGLLFGRVHLAGVDHRFAHIDLFPLATLGGPSNWIQLKSFRVVAHAHRLLNAASFLVSRGKRVPGMTIVVQRSLDSLIAMVRSLGLGLMLRRDGVPRPSVVNLAGSYGAREVVPSELFDCPGHASLGGRIYPVPWPLSLYLTLTYGSFESRPPEDEIEKAFQVFDKHYLHALQEVPLRLVAERDGRQSE